MKYFNIKFVNHATTVEDVETAIRQELDGPGQLPWIPRFAQSHP